MNTLALLNNFEREFSHPFLQAPLRGAWVSGLPEAELSNFNSALVFEPKTAIWNLTIELAGVTKDNLKIDTVDGVLRLTGEKTKGLNLGKFENEFQLPENIDENKFEALFMDGVLTLAMPLIAKKTPKAIEIK